MGWRGRGIEREPARYVGTHCTLIGADGAHNPEGAGALEDIEKVPFTNSLFLSAAIFLGDLIAGARVRTLVLP